MFTRFFKMKAQPFTERVAVEQIFRDERMTQGLARLLHMASEGTIALLTGLTGVGKSVLIKLFLSNLPQNHYRSVYVHFTNIRASSLFKLIVTELGESPKLTKEKVFMQIMDKTRKTNQTVIVIIDEAHLLDSESITNLRLLVSSALDDVTPLKMILSGQEDIKRKLKRSHHADFDNRISMKFHMKPMTKAQTIAYIDFQMTSTGSSEKVFEPEVKEMIYEYSNGIPRQINNIATACLINAAIEKVQKIDMELLHQTIKEFQS